MFVLLIVSAYLAINVFFSIGALIRDPQAAKSSVAGVAELISAEKLTFNYDAEQSLEFGNLVAFLLLLFCYILWLYVPATLISVCARILLGTMAKKKPPPRKGQR